MRRKLASYYAAAENAPPTPMTPQEKVARIGRLTARLDGVKGQFVEQGQILKKAKASKDAAAQKNSEEILGKNLSLRREVVRELRSLGHAVQDPLSD